MLDAFANNWTILVVSFFIYSFCGWIWESLVCPIATGHKIHNSGFLTGPCIPIYGSGAIVVCALFPISKDWSLIFIEGAIVACFIEYLTSYLMEKMFHARWWDYSQMRFNLNGRICLEGFFIFGFFSVTAVKNVQPHLTHMLIQYDYIPMVIASTVCITLFTSDLITTFVEATHLAKKLETVSQDLKKFADELELDIHNDITTDDIFKIARQLKDSHREHLIKKYSHRRLVKAFPDILNKYHTKPQK